MDKPLFFDGQNVQSTDMNYFVQCLENEAKKRLDAISARYGIATGLAVTSIGGLTLQVAPGIGYNNNSERCERLASSTIAVVAGDIGKYLLWRQTTTDGTPAIHPVTGALNNTRESNVWTLTKDAIITSADVILCLIDDINNPNPGDVLIDNTVRVYLAARIPPGYITDAMMDPTSTTYLHQFIYGTGVPDPVFGWTHNPHHMALADISGGGDIVNFPILHQNRFHTNGIVGGSTVLSPSVGGATITLTTIPANSFLNVNGNLLTTLPFFTHDFAIPGVYTNWLVTIDQTGVIGQIQRLTQLTYTILNCYIVWASQNTPSATYALSYTISGGNSYLQWDSGPKVLIMSGSPGTPQKYRLFSQRRSDFIDVVVDGVLPVATPLTDNITVNTYPDLSSVFLVGSVVQRSGGALQPSTLLDLRSVGTLDYNKLSDHFMDFDILQPVKPIKSYEINELCNKFVVYGFEQTTFSDILAYPITPATSGTFTISGGVCWIKGKRLTIAAPAPFTPTVATTHWEYFYACEDGTIVRKTYIIDDVEGYRPEYLLLWAIQTNNSNQYLAAYSVTPEDKRNFAARMSEGFDILYNGDIGGTPNFRYGLTAGSFPGFAGVLIDYDGITLASGQVLKIPDGATSLVGNVVDTDNIRDASVTEAKLAVGLLPDRNCLFNNDVDPPGGGNDLTAAWVPEFLYGTTKVAFAWVWVYIPYGAKRLGAAFSCNCTEHNAYVSMRLYLVPDAHGIPQYYWASGESIACGDYNGIGYNSPWYNIDIPSFDLTALGVSNPVGAPATYPANGYAMVVFYVRSSLSGAHAGFYGAKIWAK